MIIKLRKIIGILALVLAISGIAIWLGSLIFSSPQINGVVAKNNDERVDFIKKLGWEIEETPNSEDKVVVPEVFDELYEHYNSLQKENGFDLNNYKGKTLSRFTYVVLNHPEQKAGDKVLVELLLDENNEIVGGSIYSLRLDGFMTGLKKR